MGQQEQDGRSTELTRKRDAAIEEVGPEQVYGWIEAGVTTREIAEKLGLGSDDTAMWSVQNFLRLDEDRYQKAKDRSVLAHMEKAGEVFGSAPPDSTAEAKWLADRSGWHKWMAEIRGNLREQGLNVNVSLGELHLSALRKMGSVARAKAKQEEPEAIEAEYEVEEEGNPRDKYAGKQLGEIPDRR